MNETQLRVQLQTEELMMTSVKEAFQQTSESERKAVLSAQELAIAPRREMSKKSTACISRKTKMTRLTKQVAEQSTKSIAGGEILARLICSCATTGNGLFSSLYADRKSCFFSITHVATCRSAPMGTYPIDFH